MIDKKFLPQRFDVVLGWDWFFELHCHLFSGGQSQGNQQALVAYALLWCTRVYFLFLIPSVGFILFWSQLPKEFEKCQKLFYKIIFYIVPFCSVFQIFSVSDQNGIIFLTTQIIFIVFFFISWTPYAVEVKWEGNQ